MQLPKITFVNSYTDSEAGWSLVMVRLGDMLFEGCAKRHPEDVWSDFTGCRYAEQRAEIKALKYFRNQKKNESETIRKYVKALEGYKDFDKESPAAKAMYRQLNIRIREVNEITDEINKREFNLRLAIRQQDRLNNRIKSKEDN